MSHRSHDLTDESKQLARLFFLPFPTKYQPAKKKNRKTRLDQVSPQIWRGLTTPETSLRCISWPLRHRDHHGSQRKIEIMGKQKKKKKEKKVRRGPTESTGRGRH